jgi:hypothetical protein
MRSAIGLPDESFSGAPCVHTVEHGLKVWYDRFGGNCNYLPRRHEFLRGQDVQLDMPLRSGPLALYLLLRRTPVAAGCP